MITERTFAFSMLFVAAVLLAPGVAVAEERPNTANAINAPASKVVGQAKPQIVPSLIVMNARGASLKDNKLTLQGVSPNSVVFSDRPVRAAGHALTAHLLEEWQPDGSFAADPPNATISVFNKEASDVTDAVVVLRSPKLEGDKLTFDAQVLSGDIANADGPASIFIDIIGLPRTPLSFAGVARRTAYRGAWYAGATAAGAAAIGAAAAPYYRPACGYYPYPPCY